MIPSIGRIVHYTLASWDCEEVNRRRRVESINLYDPSLSNWHQGAQAHAGNSVSPGDVYPAMIVRVWGNTEGSMCNLQVFLDGNDVLWATSRSEGEGEAHWQAPVIRG